MLILGDFVEKKINLAHLFFCNLRGASHLKPYFYIITILKQKLISLKIIVKTKYLDISK